MSDARARILREVSGWRGTVQDGAPATDELLEQGELGLLERAQPEEGRQIVIKRVAVKHGRVPLQTSCRAAAAGPLR